MAKEDVSEVGFDGFESFDKPLKNQKIPYTNSFVGFMSFAGVDTLQLSTFKISLIPKSIRQFAVAVIESIQVEPGMVAPALLAIGSLGVQKKYCIHPHSDWYEPANLYVVIIAEPSERKSPTMKALMAPVYEYENLENERLAPAIAQYETKKKMLQNKIDYLTKSVTKINKKDDERYLDEGDLVTLQQELRELKEVGNMKIAVDDVTMEVLAKIMEQNNERAGIFSTEGGIFNILSGRYSDNPVIDLVLKAYSADRYALDRIGRRGQILNNPLITMLIYVQPVVVKDVMANEQFNERGLNARILYSIPPSTIGKRGYKVKKISDFDKSDYADVIERLFAIPTPARPIPIELDEEADKMAEAFYYEIEEKLKHSYGYWKAWLGKLHGTTMRIALVLHCFEYIEQSEHYKINGNTMKNAIEIGRYFEEHARAAYDMSGASDPPEVKDAKYILSRIDEMGANEFRLRDLHDLCRGRKGMEKKEGMIPGLICLIEHGYIRIQKVHAGTQNFQNPQNQQKGGRPSEMVYINPEYLKWKERKYDRSY